MNLYIYDFDGTLFRSPEPNPALWHTSLLGKINGMPQENGLGWFQETITLDEPYVPSSPSRDEWFNLNVLNDALSHLKDNNNIVCLLTGRTTLYKDIIDRILKSVDLNFHHIGLKPINEPNVAREPTMEFKKKFILNLLNEKYKNKIETVTIYEDRPKHIEAFTAFLKGLPLKKFHIEYIQDGSRYLDSDLEVQLINYLLDKNGKGMNRKKFVDYTCAKLDDQSHHDLLNMFSLPKEWHIKTHHITMNQGVYNPKYWLPDESEMNLTSQLSSLSIVETTSSSSITNTAETITQTTTSASSVTTTTSTTTATSNIKNVETLKEEYPIGKWLDLQVEAVGISPNAIAVKVKGCPTCNIIPHCTIAIHPLAKAVDSNRIRKWFNVNDFEKGKTYTLSSHDDQELSDYKQLVDKQDLQKHLVSPSGSGGKGKEQLQLPPVSITFTIPTDGRGLQIKGIIEEIGKVGIEVEKRQQQPAASPSKGASDQQKWDYFSLILNAFPKLPKKEIGNEVSSLKKWVKDNNVTDIEVLKKHISTLNL